MPTHHVELTEDNKRFVEEQVSAGLYDCESDVFEAGLRLLERQARLDGEKLARLRLQAEESFRDAVGGGGVQIRNQAELADLIRRIGCEVSLRDNNEDVSRDGSRQSY